MDIFFLLETNYIKIATVLDLFRFSLSLCVCVCVCWVLITYIPGVMNKDNIFSFCGNDSDYTMQGTVQWAWIFV